jgi:hypothetical protein
MVFSVADFSSIIPPQIGRARRILIKPYAPSPGRATQREILKRIITKIRKESEADILLIESSPVGFNMDYVYREAGYDFPRVLMLDIHHDTTFVEVENPLLKPFALPTIWFPNILLSCDFLISVSPLRIDEGEGRFSIENLLSLLPKERYSERNSVPLLGVDRVIADLYFTFPFDLGIIDGGEEVFAGEPYEVDREVAEIFEARTDYLDLIKQGKKQLDSARDMAGFPAVR